MESNKFIKFEEFIKKVRKQQGMSQSELAELVNTSYQNISSYERLRTSCTFDMGRLILNALGVSVVLENNKIYIKDGLKNMDNLKNCKKNKDIDLYQMTNSNLDIEPDYIKVGELDNKLYSKEDLSFINFNIDNVRESHESYMAGNEKLNADLLRRVYKDLSEKGFNLHFYSQFDVNLWDADQYNNEDDLVSITKDDKEIILSISGHLDLELLILEDLIEDIGKQYKEESIFIEKSIMYTAFTKGMGDRIFNALKYRNPSKLLEVMPMLAGYEEIIFNALNIEKHFFTLRDSYNPRALTISEYLGISDCASSRYIYYTYTMPNGDRVMDYNSFEGSEIVDALSYAKDYFEDYDRYLKDYNEYMKLNEEDKRFEELIVF